MEDLDNEPDTITIKTQLFSTYAVVFKQASTASIAGATDSANATDAATNISVSHLRTAVILCIVCVAVLGILLFLIFWKRRKEEEVY